MRNRAREGVPVAELCCENGAGNWSFYKRHSMYRGMSASEIRRMKELVAENNRLKWMAENRRLQKELLEEALGKDIRGRSVVAAC